MAAFRDNDVKDKTLKVNRARLLKSIQQNRDAHSAAYEDGVKGWVIEYAEAVQEHRREAIVWAEKVGSLGVDAHHKEKQPYFRAPQRPEHHLKDYDLMIAALDLCSSDEVEMTLGEIDKYERDNWDWQADFKSVTENYSNRLSRPSR